MTNENMADFLLIRLNFFSKKALNNFKLKLTSPLTALLPTQKQSNS